MSQTNIKWRTLILLVIAIAALVGQVAHMVDTGQLPLHDYVAFWSAGRLLLAGENPYDQDQLLELQRSMGWRLDGALPIWYPPWVLPLFGIMGAGGYALSRSLWLLASLALVTGSASMLWSLYGARREHVWIAWLLGLSFLPTLLAIKLGQVSPVVLLGVTGFLWFARRGRWSLAGAALVLVAVKPHAMYLVFLAVLLWMADRRNVRLPAGAAAAGLLATAVALAFDRAVLGHYLAAVTGPQPTVLATPTIGCLMRIFLGPDQAWLQYVPMVVGVAWLALFYRRNRSDWDWPRHLPLVLMVSFLTSPFGWFHDLVVLLPVLVQGAAWSFEAGQARVPRLGAVMYVAVVGAAYAVHLLNPLELIQVWVLPTLLACYLWLHHRASRAPAHLVTRTQAA